MVLKDDFDKDLEHESKANPVELAVGTLAPQATKTVKLTLTPRRSGRLVNRVTATADGGLTANTNGSVKVIETGLVLKMTGPPTRHVGLPAEWTLEVQNTGQVPLQQVAIGQALLTEQHDAGAPGGRLGDGPVEGRGALASGQEHIEKGVLQAALKSRPRPEKGRQAHSLGIYCTRQAAAGSAVA